MSRKNRKSDASEAEPYHMPMTTEEPGTGLTLPTHFADEIEPTQSSLPAAELLPTEPHHYTLDEVRAFILKHGRRNDYLTGGQRRAEQDKTVDDSTFKIFGAHWKSIIELDSTMQAPPDRGMYEAILKHVADSNQGRIKGLGESFDYKESQRLYLSGRYGDDVLMNKEKADAMEFIVASASFTTRRARILLEGIAE